MAEKKNPEPFRFEEWTIENFTFWNGAIHGDVITTSKCYIEPEFVFFLYPRGLGGTGENLVVHLHCSEPITFNGELSFVSSDGSTLLTQQVDSRGFRRNDITLPPGPRFEEVISQIEKNRDVHGDRLTVRSRIRQYVDTITNRRTKIDVFHVGLRISPKIFDDLDSSGKMISWLFYPCCQKDSGQLALRVSKSVTDWKKVILTLQPSPFRGYMSIRTQMSVLNNEDVVRTEKNEHLFNFGEIWTFDESLTTEEVTGTGRSLLLQLKIVPNSINNAHVSVCHYHKDEVSLISSEELSPDGLRDHFSTNESDHSDQSLHYLSNQLMRLYQDQDFSDFRLKCGDVTFPVHRAILCARSPAFKTMLSCDMREAASMDIEDLDPSTLALFLFFLYTGAVEDLQGESALKLYNAADKYQVPSLKVECSHFLSANVSISHVCDILSFANKHQDVQLTSAVHDFILKNYNDVLSSEEWASFMRNEPLLAVETVTRFAKKKYVKKSDSS